ncbi:MAG: efflux RND transporter permease subunit [Elusimicrobiaceae bacterium]|nr:efflux RND transporter permease subunit [Elusimicrobiaceae bacterium]
MFSKFFIDRPRFAAVIAIVMSLAGIICAWNLPVALYPEITPPEINISVMYPGASADVVSKVVGIPIENAVNGVEDMIYMSSTSFDGRYSLNVTFKSGTDPDIAQVKVQNRLQQATGQLPSEVTRQGFSVRSKSSSILGVLSFISEDDSMTANDLNDYVEDNVKKNLSKVNGVGDATVYGAKKSMRIWLDADKLSLLGLPISSVKSAIASQNYMPTLGKIGARPNDNSELIVYPLQTQGRLSSVEDFKNIIIRTDEEGGLLKLGDVAKIEIGMESYSFAGSINGKTSANMSLSLTSGANALSTMAAVKKEVERLSQFFPKGLKYQVTVDTTDFINESVHEVIWTLLITFILVVFVCYLFLQDWHATLVPSIAIPVSLLATFVVIKGLGYSINMFTLLGLVLAIGVVVDDAICVVERVILLMSREKMNRYDATVRAMQEISGPIIATTLVLLAIFVPIAFLGGITGKIYQQFAVTIATAVTFSSVNALTLSPAICATMLTDIKPTQIKVLIWFNEFVDFARNKYAAFARLVGRHVFLIFIIFAVLVVLAFGTFKLNKTSFVPSEDQGFVMANIQLPEGATLGRTEEITKKFAEIAKTEPGIKDIITIMGFSFTGGAGENVAIAMIALKPWSERPKAEDSSTAIVNRLQAKTMDIPEAEFQLMEMPAIPALGLSDGMQIKIQSLESGDYNQLDNAAKNFIGNVMGLPEVRFGFSDFTSKTPNIYLDIDRTKAEAMNVPLSNIFSTIENYLGSGYVNDINLGTQVNKVIVQSDWKYRKNLQSINNIYVPSSKGAMVPLGALVNLKTILSPRQIVRYNQYPSAGITVMLKPGASSGEAMKKVEKNIHEYLPKGYSYEWSGISYQEKQNEGQMGVLIFLALVFAYLFLVAQYESWSIPLSVMMSVVVALAGGLLGLWAMGETLSIYAQLGIVLLIGLAAKNAILIVEFSKEEHERGSSIVNSAVTGLKERYRAVLMTAFTFILGIAPLIFATGAGANSRRAIGRPVFWGMLIGTVLGLFIIPLFYVLVQTVADKLSKKRIK